MAGWVYILSNPAMPGLLKIGYTDRDPFARAKEISQATGVPFDFVVEYQVYVSHPYELEQKTHQLLHNHRVNNNREFFDCSYEDVVDVIRRSIGYLYNQIADFVSGSESSHKVEKDILQKRLEEKQNAIKKVLEEARLKKEAFLKDEKAKLVKELLKLEHEEKNKILEIEKKFVKPPYYKEVIASTLITIMAFGCSAPLFLIRSSILPNIVIFALMPIYYYILYIGYKIFRVFLPEFIEQQKSKEVERIKTSYKDKKSFLYESYNITISQINGKNQ